MQLVKYFFYLTVLIFPLGQLMSLTVPAYPEVRIHLLDVLVGLTSGAWIATALHNAVVKESGWQKFLRRDNMQLSNKFAMQVQQDYIILESITLFIIAALFSLIVNLDRYGATQLIIGSLYLVRFAAYAGLYFVVRDLRKHSTRGDLRNSTSGDSLPQYQSRWTSGRYGASRKTPDVLTSVLLTIGVVSGIFGLLQLFLYPNLRNLEYLGWDPHLNRAFGTFLDPQFLGIILVLTLLLILAELKDLKLGDLLQDLKRGYLLRKEPRFFSALIVFIVLLLTYSRSSYLALGIGLGALGVLGKFRRLGRFWYLGILGSLGVISILIFLLFKPEGVAGDLLRGETAISRIKNWNEAVRIWKEKPIFGVGFNTYRYAHLLTSGDSVCSDPKVGRPISCDARLGFLPDFSHSSAGVDNSFLFVLATTGVVGLLAYLNIWRVLLLSNSAATKRSYPDVASGELRFKKVAIAAAVFTHALFNNTLFYPWVMWWVWMYFARFNVGRSTSRCTFGERDRP